MCADARFFAASLPYQLLSLQVIGWLRHFE
jgi:hypothetical protein